ncbi:MAG: TIGR03936 family radical SAM-associated protein [Defluviitaleaceae bacterium]|nr:TIGR03936 family radical SAM-associated protein [Defluviitaleaceae bacterium]MCL2836168.1 TIGR03936 family radical SAM-associated protein [Defluviitaleaceae bacterium]
MIKEAATINNFFRYRLTYEKTGVARYIGHLDLQNLFQRAIRRAGIKSRYSEGFNPHPIISFASPLSVGTDGLAEISDIDLAERIAPDDIVGRLNSSFPSGLTALSCSELSSGEKSAAALLRRALYGMTIRADGIEPDMNGAVRDFLSRENVFISVRREGQPPKETDIRGLVYELRADGNVVEALVACGGSGNLKPQVLADVLCSITNIKLCGFTTEYCRRELIF